MRFCQKISENPGTKKIVLVAGETNEYNHDTTTKTFKIGYSTTPVFAK